MKKNINIWDGMNRIPAGTMIIPMLISALLNTISIHTLDMGFWDFIGNPSKDLFGTSGQMLLIGLTLFITGTMVSPKDFKECGKRGIWILLARMIPSYIAVAIFYLLFGLEGIAGIDFLTFSATVCSINAALFLAVTDGVGDTSDTCMFPLFLILAMPLVPFLLISSFGHNLTSSNEIVGKLMQILSMFIPFILGFILGNLDNKVRSIYSNGNKMITLILGIQFGSMIDFVNILNPRLLLTAFLVIILFYIFTIILPFMVERFIFKRPAYVTVGTASLAGVTLTVPLMFYNYQFGETILESGSELISNSVAVLAIVLLVTDLLCPLLSKINMKLYFKHASKEDATRVFGQTHPELIEKNYELD